jgi:signal peptidase II
MQKKISVVLIIVGSILAVDQYSKQLVSKNIAPGYSIPIVKNIFHITFVKNQGIAFGFFQKGNPFFIFLTAVLIGTLLVFSKKFVANFYSRIGFSLMLAGALGSFADRLRYGYIIDFLDFGIWPVFNLSDIAICAGAVFLCIQYCLK